MQSPRHSRVWLSLAVLAALMLATVAASTRNANQFAGYFDYSNAQEQGDLVQVTLHLQLYNQSDMDLRGVIVTLVDSSPAMTFRGNFQPIKSWKKQQFVNLQQEFSISKREFAEWNGAPAQPNLVILYQDSKGQTFQRGAQISRRQLVRVLSEE